MKKALLIYNSNSGILRSLSGEQVLAILRSLGYSPMMVYTENAKDLDSVLGNESADLVVVAGGDGSVREVVKRIYDREDLELFIVPVGTANNIARSLGFKNNPQKWLEGLAQSRAVKFDLGEINLLNKTDFFLEGVGFGLFSEILKKYDPTGTKNPMRSLSTSIEVFSQFDGVISQLTLDGDVHYGKFLGCEILNTNALGPRLNLSPQAKPTDGLLDVVMVRKKNKEKFLDYLLKLASDEFYELDSVEVFRANEVRFPLGDLAVHYDTEFAEDLLIDNQAEEVVVRILPGKINLRVPKSAD